MLFAVVDIETTGSYASGNGITEIAIVIHDGKKVIDFFESLVNPHVPIPFFIQRLTGINNDMVANAPAFREIAGQVNELLQDKVFVAHNVNFDYSFVKHQLKAAGFELDSRKLCTVRLARKVLPGMAGYSLGKLTHQLGIRHTEAHRAGGDALATAELLGIIIERDNGEAIKAMLKGRNRESYLPPHLPVSELDRLPSSPGVYYFQNAAGKTIYVGKAKNLHRRVKSHFSNNKPSRQKQDFIRETIRITYKQCATELMAEILESAEIRRLWPIHNRSQRGYLAQFALLTYEDQQGYMRFTIERNRTGYQALYTFNTVTEGERRIKELIDEYGLCPRLCNIACYTDNPEGCDCGTHLPPAAYNERVTNAVKTLKKSLPTFALVDKGLDDNEHSCILVMQGVLVGMGYLDYEKSELSNMETLQKNLEPLQDNDHIRNLIFRHATEFPEKCVMLANN